MGEAIFITKWKEEIKNQLILSYGNKLKLATLEELLNSLIKERLKNRTLKIFNNYTNKLSVTNILTLYDLIEKNNIIMAGGGCLFLPHGAKRNLLVEFIRYNKAERSATKKRRSQYKKGTREYQVEDIDQANIKLTINSWYGCMGYPGFLMYNVFIAESITNQGKHIITSCTASFENYLGNALKFTCEGELFTYVNNILGEFNDNNFKDILLKLSDNFTGLDYNNLCVERLLSKCDFEITDGIKIHINNICKNMTRNEAIVLYYKTNLEEFNNLPFMRHLFKKIIIENGNLAFGALSYMKEEVRDKVLYILSLYKLFVFYPFPTYDKVRKAMYTIKTKCLYTDTDSVFISLASFVSYTLSLFNNNNAEGLSLEETKTTGAFLNFYFADIMVDISLKCLCACQNIPEDVAQALVIKNEFFYSRIVFMDVKKRYIAYALYQEGNKIPESEALDIKGLDFKKSTTNAHLKSFYTNITLEELLIPNEVNPASIFRRMLKLKSEIESGIRNGDRRFFKQLTVKLPQHYKNPYSTQGVISTMVWNILCPDMMMSFPAEVYIVPIHSLKFDKPSEKKITTAMPTDNKFVRKYADMYPDIYDLLYREIYTNTNPLIRHMSMNYVALPRNEEIKIPQHIIELIDFPKIIEDALSLYLPILNSVGLKTLPTTTTTTHMSNIVNI